MATTIHVEGIAAATSDQEVRDFFSFCGKIVNLSVTPTTSEKDASKSATVTFEKETAAKTALLLDNTQLGPSQVHVKSAASLAELSRGHDHEEEIEQEDKPRSRILAEYLAHGYVLSDKVIERALALDTQHGISAKFQQALNNFDSKYKATDKAKTVDDKYGVTRSATQAWNGFNSYFDAAVNTPSGQKLRQFYDAGNRQVLDVHNEARHLANLKQGKPVESQGESAAGSSSGAPAAAQVTDPSASEKIPVDEKA